MRITLIVLLTISAAPAANAETRYYDRHNLPAGHSETRGNETRFYDRHNLPTGHSETRGQ